RDRQSNSPASTQRLLLARFPPQRPLASVESIRGRHCPSFMVVERLRPLRAVFYHLLLPLSTSKIETAPCSGPYAPPSFQIALTESFAPGIPLRRSPIPSCAAWPVPTHMAPVRAHTRMSRAPPGCEPLERGAHGALGTREELRAERPTKAAGGVPAGAEPQGSLHFLPARCITLFDNFYHRHFLLSFVKLQCAARLKSINRYCLR